MLTKKQEAICDRYSLPDENGHVHCAECPLMISPYYLMCKANASYNRHTREWEFDEVNE